ncbi:MAG TPA: zf-HC2 domain-containing protein [Gemmatimonadales bacterium]|nr:zf-HC2 domain-containing protein [Gemmatimonadales bacterium]
MRHIPEDELHAYLDQALSRSQCVEIERHLARCPRCQLSRDSIAALRDRTTALLARVGPPPIIPPSFEVLVARANARQARRWRWIRTGSWAASIGGVLVLGWWMSDQLFRVDSHNTVAVAPPVTVSRDVPAVTAVSTVPAAPKAAPAVTRPKPRRAPPQLVRTSRPVGDEAPAASDFALATEVPAPSSRPAPAEQLSDEDPAPFELHDLVAQPVGDDPGLNGLWRTVVPDKDYTDRRGDIALVPGLPVLQMRVQPGTHGDDVTAVDQSLESGETIRTISGPAARVLNLVNEDASADTTRVDGTPGNMTVTIRQADRMVAVTGPANAVSSLLARVNVKAAKRRY